MTFDEIGSAKDPRVPPRLAYDLINGVERGRSEKDGTARPLRQFRTVLLSSGEYSIREACDRAGVRHHEGQEIRFLDLAVRADESRSQEFKEQGARDFSKAMSAALADHHGHAGPLFMQQLFRLAEIHSNGDVRGFVRRCFEFADKEMLQAPGDAADNIQRARQQFVLFALAGELAICSAVLGERWRPGDMIAACGDAFRAWMDARAERGTLNLSGEEMRAEEEFRRFVEANEGRFRSPEQPLGPYDVAWVRDLPGLGRAYYVQNGKLKGNGCTMGGLELARHLAPRGMVLSGAATVGDEPGMFPARLGGKLVKIYGFLLPEVVADGEDATGDSAAQAMAQSGNVFPFAAAQNGGAFNAY